MNQQFLIPPKSAHAFLLPSDQTVKVIDIQGQQVSDLVTFSETDPKEKFDQARTRVNNWTNLVTKGTVLYSNRNTPLFKVIQDDVGVHDIMFPCCNRFVYETIFHAPEKKGCFENLAEAVEQFNLKSDDLPNPFNIFMNTFVDSKTGEIGIRTSPSKAGDSITMKALTNLIVAFTACSDDLSDCNGKKCKPIKVEISDSRV